jgi:hypothetical protein
VLSCSGLRVTLTRCSPEGWVGVFCACLPSLKCLSVQHFRGIFSSNRHGGNRGSLLSMIRISVTVDNAGDNTNEGVASAWRVMWRERKKLSCGSSEPDLEADGAEGSEGCAEPRWSHSDEEQGRRDNERNVETVGRGTERPLEWHGNGKGGACDLREFSVSLR